jgi:uncharacterized RDD family membrane protein YckC
MSGELNTESIFPVRVVTYANVWERVGAFIIDALIVLLFSVIVSHSIPLPYCWIFTAWIYEATQISGYYQATIGQRTMGIKVSNMYGGRLDLTRASMRHFSKYVSLLTALSGYLIIILDDKSQCLHDKVAQSVVVTEESYHAAI